jgi:hypothetical protein
MIIDDNSNYDFVSFISSCPLTNCFIIQSEFPGRGEILAYYYFHRFHLFEKAVILHDSTFLQTRIDEKIDDIAFLWTFPHDFDNVNVETMFIRQNLLPTIVDSVVTTHYDVSCWTGCFGVQSVISYSFLDILSTKYGFFRLLSVITSRNERYHLERIFASLCFHEKMGQCPILFGSIFSYYVGWGYTWEQYLFDKKTEQNNHLPIVKVWTGR